MLIDDDIEIVDYLSSKLEERGFNITTSITCEDGLQQCLNESIDIIILDRMLNNHDGLSILEKVRKKTNTPVLILSCLGSLDEKVKGFKTGCDDYLQKPCHIDELIVRLEALYRRTFIDSGKTLTLKAKQVKLDLLSRKAFVNGQELELLPKEFKLLEFLIKNKNNTVTRTMILENVWNYSFDPSTNIVDVHISKMRKKIETFSTEKFIKTVKGVGYTVEV